MRFLLAVLFLVMTAGFFLSNAYLSGGGPVALATMSFGDVSTMIGSLGVVAALLAPGVAVVVTLAGAQVVQRVGWPASLGGVAVMATGVGLYWLTGPDIGTVLSVLQG